ncbi:MAG: TauD/TfdA dioxygenase family protein [Microthrixaceae bacterium]
MSITTAPNDTTPNDTAAIDQTAPVDLDVRPLTSVLGAEVHGLDLRTPPDAELTAAIRAALVEHKVLFFRGQELDRAQQVVFGRAFGPLTEGHPLQGSPEGFPEIMVVDSRRTSRAEGRGPDRPEFAPPRLTLAGWHTDITFVVNPALGSILRAVEVPAAGGDTLWTDLEAAYEDLSPAVRDLVDGLQAVHRWHGYDVDPKTGAAGAKPKAVHPVVRVHPESGRRSLFVNPVFTRYLVGLSDRENEHLLRLLFEQVSRPEFTVRFRWEPGDIAFWDNRSTAHLGPVDAAVTTHDRVLERVTIVGDEPVGPNGFVSRSLRGERFS